MIYLFYQPMQRIARIIFEAMVAGCSIITTINSGSIIKHKKNGLIIDPGKPKQIANSIKYFMKNKAKIKIFGNNNIKIIKTLSSKTMGIS